MWAISIVELLPAYQHPDGNKKPYSVADRNASDKHSDAFMSCQHKLYAHFHSGRNSHGDHFTNTNCITYYDRDINAANKHTHKSFFNVHPHWYGNSYFHHNANEYSWYAYNVSNGKCYWLSNMQR